MASYLVGLIGAGIGPSLSPPLHEREADHHGLRYVYRLIDIAGLGLGAEAAGDLVHAARRLGFDGLNITYPCKQTVIEHLDELSPDAEMLGAVNTVVFAGARATGHNTDWSGFAESFVRGLPGAATRRVVQLGAGGAGAAVAHALLTLGSGQVMLTDKQPGRSKALAERLARRFGADRAEALDPAHLGEALSGADGLINVTPTGMAAHPGTPLDPDLLRPSLWVADIVYRPLETELLRRARAAGCRTLDGSGMVVFQAARSFELFTGRPPDTGRMLRHLAELI